MSEIINNKQLINKKVINSTEQITKMTTTETKTMEETITYLLLGMEEGNNMITFQQANSNYQNNVSEEIRDTPVKF